MFVWLRTPTLNNSHVLNGKGCRSSHWIRLKSSWPLQSEASKVGEVSLAFSLLKMKGQELHSFNACRLFLRLPQSTYSMEETDVHRLHNRDNQHVTNTGIMQLMLNFQREQDQSPQQPTTHPQTHIRAQKRVELTKANLILWRPTAENPVGNSLMTLLKYLLI